MRSKVRDWVITLVYSPVGLRPKIGRIAWNLVV